MGRIVRHTAIVGGLRVSGVVDSAAFAVSVVARHRGAGESESAGIGDTAPIAREVAHDAAAIDDEDSRIVDSAAPCICEVAAQRATNEGERAGVENSAAVFAGAAVTVLN